MKRSRQKHPTPWRHDCGGSTSSVVDANGEIVLMPGMPRELTSRIVRAVNAFESPVARAERAVVKAAVACRKGAPYVRLQEAVDRLLAARARAKKARGEP